MSRRDVWRVNKRYFKISGSSIVGRADGEILLRSSHVPHHHRNENDPKSGAFVMLVFFVFAFKLHEIFGYVIIPACAFELSGHVHLFLISHFHWIGHHYVNGIIILLDADLSLDVGFTSERLQM